ncbi:hypothetical protein NEIMUCOT_04186 [Neisseria mucosa ATCC 25996]|uniref:Uncharacterized protein n=1 Tax=Neisseria mucosa (strain ATCC 25996 / DSM 4631 / NCTC 10774 / M26) TaxID=546266 RepID=D2ZU98_NEIM2|nr:hypothetical protein NEIMUCOT_04186 [Neisseria mucosa ATCC 25996]
MDGVTVVPVPQACSSPAPAAAEQARRKWRREVCQVIWFPLVGFQTTFSAGVV